MTIQPLRCGGTRGQLLALALLAPITQVHAADGTWNSNAPGNWSDSTNWAGGVVASGSGAIADFSTLNITGDHVINIDAPFTIGTLISQDLTNASNFWTFSGVGPLTLDNGVPQPVINVLNRPPVLSAPLAGTNGLSKTGAGFITLSGNNSALSGVLNLQNVTGTNSSGLGLSGTQALGGMTTINILGTATTGPYLGLSNNIVIGAGITTNISSQGGNAGPAGAIRSEGGVDVTNVINGPINITGPGVRVGNTASKLLELNGVITGGSNGLIFRTSVNDGIHVTNTGNSWGGITNHSEGILWFKPGTLPDTTALIIAASAAGTVHTSGTFTRPLGTAAGQVRLGSAETSVNARPLGLTARGGDLTVNFGGAGAEVFFNNFTTSTTGTPGTINTNIFNLNGAQGTHKLTLANPLNLNGAARTLQINTNTVELTGGLTGDAFTYTKTGAGILSLPSASTWLGDLSIGSTGDSVNGGIVRPSHVEAFGAPGTVKNINALGNNRGTSIVELSGGLTIDADKTLRLYGKNFAMTGATGSGLQQSLRNVSGDNAWNGSVLIFNQGGSYALESLAGTLTVGSDPATTSVIRNDVASSSRTLSLYGPGNFVIHNKISDNGAANITLNKSGTGNLTIARSDNDFDTAPNLFAGTTEISSLGSTGIGSSLGLAGSFNLGSTLRYTGTGETSDRTLSLLPTGGTLDASGSAAWELTSTTFNHNAGVATTVTAPFAIGATELVLNETAGIAVGQTIALTVANTAIPANTTVTAVNVDTRTVTLSNPTTAASTNGLGITIGAPNNISRTLTLTGANTGGNSLAAPLANPAGTGLLGVTKEGPGSWTLNGFTQTYTGPTTVNQGMLGFDGAFPAASTLTVAPAATLALANVSLPVNPGTGLALDIDGSLAITGPVYITLPQAAPTGPQTVLEYASISGAANLTSNYRGTAFTSGATSASINTSAGIPLTWAGSDFTWDTKLTSSWKNAANAPQTFFWGDPVRFDDSGSLQPFVSMSGELRPASVTIDTDIVTYTLDGNAGFLSGPFHLTKAGTTTTLLGGANTFTGGITINEGVLRSTSTQGLGGIGNAIAIASGAQLDVGGTMNANRDYDVTLAGTGPDGSGAMVNTGASFTNGVRSLNLTADATIGGTGRFDVRPSVAGTGTVDLAGFTLTKTGGNQIGLIDSYLTDGTININEGILSFTRIADSGVGEVNVNSGGTMWFENYTTGSFSRQINLNDGGTLRLLGSNLTSPSNVVFTGSPTFDVAGGASLTFNNAVTGNGAGNLIKSTGAGLLALTGTVSYPGTTTIGGGTLVIGSQAIPATLGAGEVINDGTLVLNRGDTAYVVNNPISGTGALTIGQVGAGSNPDSLVTVTGANTFAGNVTVNSGALKIFNVGALGTGAKTITITNGTNGQPQLLLDGSGGNISLPADMSFVTSSTNPARPAIGNLAGDTVVAGPITLAQGGGSTAISTFGGTLSLNGNIAANVANRRLILGGTGGSGTVNGVISNGVTEPFGLDKVGPLTWTLTNANTYTGTTAITEGTLLVNGNQGLATGAVSIASGATLGGTGTVGGSVTAAAGSTIAPGTGIGTLATVAAVILDGSLAIELDSTTSDRLSVGGSLDIDGAALNVSLLGAATQPAYIIASYGVLSGSFGSTSGIPSGYVLNYNYNGASQIALVPGTDAYAGYETANGIVGAGSNTDSDNDGIANGIEFVLGTDPSGPGSDSSALLPASTIDTTYLNVVYRRTDASLSYSPLVEYGSALAGWTTAVNGVNGVIITPEDDFFGAGIDRVTVKIPRALAAPSAKLFARLRVNIP
ncbi:beta strand repeat-containing protein [Luteolibacter sp. Populi]|uniref:beta strand repeat-containing protein n=1 Tax=Luteolibacter sp. Populi TaxID=3230487 RepID=UPI0034658C57